LIKSYIHRGWLCFIVRFVCSWWCWIRKHNISMELQPLRVTIFTSRSRKLASSAFILVQKSNDDRWCLIGRILTRFCEMIESNAIILELVIDTVRVIGFICASLTGFNDFFHLILYYVSNESLGALNFCHTFIMDA